MAAQTGTIASARGGIDQATGGDANANTWLSKLQGSLSAGVSPESETAFAVKEAVSRAAGDPQVAHWSAQSRAIDRAVEANDPSLMQFGDKTEEYASKIDPNQPPFKSATGVNDFRQAKLWGYPGRAEGVDPSVSATQHRFLDYETALTADRANQTNLGGRSNWTGEQIQAVPWVTQKAEDLGIPFEQAAMAGADYYPKHAGRRPTSTSSSRDRRWSTEMHPAPGASGMSADQTHRLCSESTTTDAVTGRDAALRRRARRQFERTIPGTGMGMPTLPTVSATGVWRKDENSPYESNPLEIGRPLVSFDSSTSLAGDVSKTISDARNAKTSQPSPPFALLTGDRAIPLGQNPTGKDISAAIGKAAPLDPNEPMTLTGNLKDLGTWEGFDPQGKSTIAGVPAGNKVMSQSGKDILDADAATKAYFGAQQRREARTSFGTSRRRERRMRCSCRSTVTPRDRRSTPSRRRANPSACRTSPRPMVALRS